MGALGRESEVEGEMTETRFTMHDQLEESGFGPDILDTGQRQSSRIQLYLEMTWIEATRLAM